MNMITMRAKKAKKGRGQKQKCDRDRIMEVARRLQL
jgi:hypothetical protein